jgi:hypothetical protein
MNPTRLRVILDFSGFESDPERIVSLIGVEPDYITRKGAATRFTESAKVNSWSIKTQERPCDNLNELIDELLVRLSPNWNAVVEHSRDSQVEMLCEIWASDNVVTSVVGVSSKNLRRLTELGASLGFDHYL